MNIGRLKWRVQCKLIAWLVGGRGVLMNLDLDTRTKIVLETKPKGYLIAGCNLTGLLPSGRMSRSQRPTISVGAVKS